MKEASNTTVVEEEVVPKKKTAVFKDYDADQGNADLLRYAAQMKRQ